MKINNLSQVTFTVIYAKIKLKYLNIFRSKKGTFNFLIAKYANIIKAKSTAHKKDSVLHILKFKVAVILKCRFSLPKRLTFNLRISVNV